MTITDTIMVEELQVVLQVFKLQTSGVTTLFDSTFYVMTDDFNVYKCLDNNGNANFNC